MPSLKVVENAARKFNKKMPKVGGGEKEMYVFVEEKVNQEKSPVIISNSRNSDKSVTVKEEETYYVVQLNANVT